MADDPNRAAKPKQRFLEVGQFKKLRVTDAVRERRMGSEFIVQIMMLIVVSAVTFLAAQGAASGATAASIRQLFLRTSQYPHIITGDRMNGTAFVDITEVCLA